MKIRIIAECVLCGSQERYNVDSSAIEGCEFLPLCASADKPYCSNDEGKADRDDRHYHEEQDHIAMEKAKENK